MLIYAKRVLSKEEKDRFRRLRNDMVFSWGGSYKEMETIQGHADTSVSKKLYTRDNLSCSSNIEIPYYSAGYPNICIFCGRGRYLKPVSALTFPQCENASCSTKEPVKRTKLKQVQKEDKRGKKKKIVTLYCVVDGT